MERALEKVRRRWPVKHLSYVEINRKYSTHWGKLLVITKSMRKEAQFKFCREVESDPTGKLLWTKWRQRAQAGSSELPSVVLDKDETLVVDPVKVRATWASYVERLGLEDTILEDATESNEEIQDILHERLQDVGDSIRKDAPRNKFDDLYARRVIDALTRLDPYTRVVPELDRQISWKEVWKTIAGLPRGKAAGEDGITAELLKLAGLGASMALAVLFNRVLDEGRWPPQWRRAYLLPLFKGEGSRIDPSNYRMLAIGSVVAKVLEKILDVRLRKWSERVGALCDLQGGFREGRGTADQIFLLNEIVGKRAEQNECTLLAFVDVRKAYDRVYKPGLLAKLYSAGVGGKCFSLLKDILSQVRRVVSIHGVHSEDFPVDAGYPKALYCHPFCMLCL